MRKQKKAQGAWVALAIDAIPDKIDAHPPSKGAEASERSALGSSGETEIQIAPEELVCPACGRPAGEAEPACRHCGRDLSHERQLPVRVEWEVWQENARIRGEG